MIAYLKNLITTSPSKLITYEDFISAVLYHPELGYYMKNKQKIGRRGDFITTSNISAFFGKMAARWFAFLCQENQIAPVFCEVGAGNGRFAHAFMTEWKDEMKTPLRYIIVETSPYHRKLQNELLDKDFIFEQAASLNELESFEGMIFSNELFDALPVHVIEKDKGCLFEVMIGIKNEQLFEEKMPLTNRDIIHFLKENHLHLKGKQRIEIPLQMESMVHKMSAILTKGLIVTVDYGYTYEEWMEPSRRKGSLRGYYQHGMIENVLEHPGEMDITSHVHFDWLIKAGEQFQLNFLLKLRQDEFLLKTGILQELQNHYDPNPFSEISRRNRSIRSLIIPSGISSYFHVLIQQKGLDLETAHLFPF